VVGIDFEFAYDLDLLIVVGWVFTITELYRIRNLYRAVLAILRDVSSRMCSFDRRDGGVGCRIIVLRLGVYTTRSAASTNRTSSGSLVFIE
jgi:hypothetical protein